MPFKIYDNIIEAIRLVEIQVDQIVYSLEPSEKKPNGFFLMVFYEST